MNTILLYHWSNRLLVLCANMVWFSPRSPDLLQFYLKQLSFFSFYVIFSSKVNGDLLKTNSIKNSCHLLYSTGFHVSLLDGFLTIVSDILHDQAFDFYFGLKQTDLIQHRALDKYSPSIKHFLYNDTIINIIAAGNFFQLQQGQIYKLIITYTFQFFSLHIYKCRVWP